MQCCATVVRYAPSSERSPCDFAVSTLASSCGAASFDAADFADVVVSSVACTRFAPPAAAVTAAAVTIGYWTARALGKADTEAMESPLTA